MTALPGDVLANIPGWEDATCTELTGGMTNKAWRVVQGERTGVLKIDKGPRELPFNTRGDEANVQKAAAKAGLAPNVILANDGLYLTEFLEGTVWERACLEKAGNLLGTEDPELILSDRLFWRFSVVLGIPTLDQPGSGELYRVGQILLAAVTGEIEGADTLAEELRGHVAATVR